MDETKTILVVEMSQSIVDILRIVLEEAGYSVRSVSDAEEARDIISTSPTALVLIDMDMDVHGATELIRWTRDKQGPWLPVVLLGTDDETRRLARSIDVDGWLPMPFDIDNLINMVNHLVI